MTSMISNWGTYFKKLIPSFGKKGITIDLAHAYEELNQIVQPMYSSASDVTLKGQALDDTTFRFKKGMEAYKGTILKTISKTIDMILDNEDKLYAEINSTFKDQNLKVIVDYYQLNLLKYCEGLTFFNEYTRRWLNIVVYQTITEAFPNSNGDLGKYSKINTTTKDTTSPFVIASPTFNADLDFILDSNNIESFIILVNMLSIPFDKYLKSIENLKGHTYNDTDWGRSENVTTQKLDPYRCNFIPVTWNPIYGIGLMVNGWRIQRHERNKAEFARLQLMLLTMNEQRTITKDPNKAEQLEKQINYYSNISNKIAAKIETLETE